LTGNLTLTKTTGSSLGSTSSQYAILNVTPSASTWTITVPAASKTYYINNLSSTYTFAFKASGGTAITIAAGEKCVVAYNGTDFAKIGASLATPYTANGVVYASSSSALTTGSALTFDGTNLGNTQNTASPIGLVLNNSSGSTSAGTRLTFKYGGTNTGYVGNQFDGGDFNNQYQANQFHIWLNSASETMRLTSTGLGIGTSSPDAKLTVYGNAPAFTMQTSRSFTVNRNWQIGVDQITEGNWTLTPSTTLGGSTYTTPAITVSPAGNLGLGVTPSAWVGYKVMQAGIASFAGGSSGAYLLQDNAFTDNSGAGWKYINSGYAAAQYYAASGAHVWRTAASGTAGNAITFTQAMTLDASGNLLLNTTSQNGVGRLSIKYSGATEQGINIRDSSDASGSAYMVFGSSSGTTYGTITNNANSGVLYNVTSDYRLKENIVDAPEFGSVIDSIQVRSFDWKTGQIHQRAGFIAQELITVAPEAVHQPADPDEMMAVDYSKLVPMLVKEIQSLRIRIAQLESK
jgi:hypothetical protein